MAAVFGLEGGALAAVVIVLSLLAVTQLIARAKGLKDVEATPGTGPIPGLLGLLADIGGSFRLAAPDSWWARRFYDQDKRTRAAEKHARRADREEASNPSGYSQASADWLLERDRHSRWP